MHSLTKHSSQVKWFTKRLVCLPAPPPPLFFVLFLDKCSKIPPLSEAVTCLNHYCASRIRSWREAISLYLAKPRSEAMASTWPLPLPHPVKPSRERYTRPLYIVKAYTAHPEFGRVCGFFSPSCLLIQRAKSRSAPSSLAPKRHLVVDHCPAPGLKWRRLGSLTSGEQGCQIAFASQRCFDLAICPSTGKR